MAYGAAAAREGFIVKDSGERAEFDSGMVRDTTEGKLDYRIINYGPMKLRWVDHLNAARVKYPDVSPGIPNWTMAKGIKEFDRFLESAERHFGIWMAARTKELTRWGRTGTFTAESTPEDEAAAVFFNINGTEFVRDVVKPTKTLAETFDELPFIEESFAETPIPAGSKLTFAEATVPEPAEATEVQVILNSGKPYTITMPYILPLRSPTAYH